MRVLVCGGREYRDYDRLKRTMDALDESSSGPIDIVIHGGARGADTLADRWACERGIHVAVVKAQWERYGRSAGPRRNRAMLLLKPDVVLAFPGGPGTADMDRLAREAKIAVFGPMP